LPLNVNNWEKSLAYHPNRPLADLFLTGITKGFYIGFKQQTYPLKSAKQNLSCALQHPETIEKYLAEEIALEHIVGPFHKVSVHVNWFGVIPSTINQISGD